MPLRVIAGDFRRRLLQTPRGNSTRPYTDRVRQMVFDRLDVTGARVADVFAGVGTMGIEALSRGADSCVFFESDTTVFECLRSNVDLIAASARTICWKADVRRTSFRPQGGFDCLPYSLIFFDPPYADVPHLAPGHSLFESLRRLARDEISEQDATLILRTPERTDLQESGGWTVDERWEISTMIVWRLKKSSWNAGVGEDKLLPGELPEERDSAGASA